MGAFHLAGYHIMTIFIISTPTILKTKGKSKYVHTSFKYQLPKFSHVQTNLNKKLMETEKKSVVIYL